MFKNKLPISSILGIGVISLGSTFIISSTGIVLDTTRSNPYLYYYLIVGNILFLSGIGMFFNIKWTRPILAICFISFGCTLLLSYFDNDNYNIYDIMSDIVFCLGLVAFLILLLYNRKVSEEFGIKHQDKETEDILDLME